jgi:MFS family permease
MPAESGAAQNEDGCPREVAQAVDPAAIARHNLLVESLFCGFSGVLVGMIVFAAPVIAVTCLGAGYIELSIIACAFPCGAFLGPLWASLGRRWGMKRLVTQMAVWANLPLFLMFWVNDAIVFTAIITLSQLLYSAMRMGQSSMYRASYPRAQWGKVLGLLTFWTFLTMVPTVLLAGWLAETEPNIPPFLSFLVEVRSWLAGLGYSPGEVYRVLYPLAAVFGLIGCRFYALLRLLETPPASAQPFSITAGWRSVQRVIATDPAYLLFQLAFFLSGSAFFLSGHIMIILAHDRLEFGPQELALWLQVVPQIALALGSPVWGQVMDRIGIVRTRMLISILMTTYLICYFAGIVLVRPELILVGSLLRGISEGGGQVTWPLAASHFAPRPEDVPLYSGIHFTLNGIRGLTMPWLGSLLFLLTGAGTILAAVLLSAVSIPVIQFSFRYGDGPKEHEEEPVPLPPESAETAAEVG